MAEKTVVFITGANTGIGYETVRALVGQTARTYHVFLGSRSVEKGNAAASALRAEFPQTTSVVEVIQIDVSSDESINAAYETVKASPGYVDVLVNNAGNSLEMKMFKGEYTMREAWNQMYDVNVTGAQILTHTFVPLLLKSRTRDARLLFLTSGLAQLETMYREYYPGPPPPAGWPKQAVMSPDGYRSSKTALNMMMLAWHWNLKEDGVKVWSISPGFLATDLGGAKELLKARGAGDPATGGVLIRRVIEGERDGDVGKVVDGQGVQSF
ncbi:NAD(P)-binding domain protein [Cordyceps fumosorosea ARSEF 2679]|uniref:NAD(P)-binding domain protein n=1 Tax=Cordyceps fumosorosea (strain ARSEF 2679) TaxID=1081104 RepID=A0A167S589_CORFA|nr:NAD(P)-binding domain protein [Cordyceps fumosorosea ARSEF 2679]OAA59270.1 NAD(P)-binding domain protein [Cordyceps fumosorosea ARSEF 2679]